MKLQRILVPFASTCGAIGMFTLTGCAIVDPRADFDRASGYVEKAIGAVSLYRPDDDGVIAQRVATFMQNGLTADEAVLIALLNNARLQAAMIRLGVSRAEFVQSGLFTNPAVSFSLRWPAGGGLTNLQVGIAQNIAELWQIPRRKQAAEADLHRAIIEAAREACVLGLDARVAYWGAVRAERDRGLAGENLELGQKLIAMAVSRRDAGAGSDVDVNLARSQHIDLEIKLRNASLAAIEAHAALAKLLGLTTPPREIVLVEALAEPGIWTLTPEAVIASARESRLDVQATKLAVAAAKERVAYEKSRFPRSLELGLSVERSARYSRGGRDWLEETAYASAQAGQLTPPSLHPREEQSTDWVVGPEIGVELPIFDQNQAQIARAQYVHQQAMKLLDALEREITQDAHVAFEGAETAADNARFYMESVLPLREQGLTLAEGAYTAGQTTLLSVQEAQRLLLAARSGYVGAITHHVLAIVELERVAGRPIAALIQASVRSTGGDASGAPGPPVAPASAPAENQP